MYSEYMEIGTDGPAHAGPSELLKEQPEFQQGEWKMQHSINALLSRVDFDKIGGFDESLPGWEDWDFFVKAAVRGFCGRRLAEPVWCYRKHTGHRRDESFALTDQLLPVLKERWSDYYNGVKPMGSCCPGNGDAVMAAKQAILSAEAALRGDASFSGAAPARPAPEQRFEQTSGLQDVVRMEFVGEQIGAVTFFGVDGAGRQYRGGNNAFERFADVSPRDVAKLESTALWRRVAEPEPEPETRWLEPEIEPEFPAPPDRGLVPAAVALDGEPIGDVDQLLAEIPAPPLSEAEVAMAKALAAETQATQPRRTLGGEASNGRAFEAAAPVPASMSADMPELEVKPATAKARGKAKK